MKRRKRKGAIAINTDDAHDYCVGSFRLYSMCGCPKPDELEQLDLSAPSYEDIAVVGRTLEELRKQADGEDVVNCVNEVYLKRPRELSSKGTVTLRVRRASERYCISEATVYRNLRRACRAFAKNRGLRTAEDEAWLLNMFK